MLTYNEWIKHWLHTAIQCQWLLVSVNAQNTLNSSQTGLQRVHCVVQLTQQ